MSSGKTLTKFQQKPTNVNKTSTEVRFPWFQKISIYFLISTKFIKRIYKISQLSANPPWWVFDEFLMNCWGLLIVFLCVRLYFWWVSDNLFGTFSEVDSGAGFVEISEFLRKYVEIIRNCYICWVSVISDEFSGVSDELLMSFW